MRRRLIWGLLLCGWAIIVLAEQPAARDIWPQATAAADSGDVDLSIKKTNELVETGKSYGIRTYPLYASASAGMASQTKSGRKSSANASTVTEPPRRLWPSISRKSCAIARP